jgi:alpha-tubulin suppressor-like RCC1 family protein
MVSPDVRRFFPLFLFVLGFLGLLAPIEASADSSERPDRSLFGTISIGGASTCAITSASEVQCWGVNHVGQLGNGNQNDSFVPVQVQGLSGAIESVSATPYNGCALTSGGGMKCWGTNHSGQLGDGTRNSSNNTANQVLGLTSGVRAMAGSEFFNCALLHNGEVKCWGETYIDFDNDGIEDSSNTPVAIPGLPQDLVAISAGGGKFVCVVSVSTGVWCWGANSLGQLGDSSNIDRFTPVRVSNLTTSIASLSSGQGHTCIVTNSGTVKCWGGNGFGRLGDGTQNNSNVPRDVVGLNGPAIAVTAGYHHTCALLVSGTVQCWGWNAGGQLGDGTTNDSNAPVSVQGLTSAVEALTVGSRNSCVLLSNREIKCWGDNTYGQLGDGTDTNRSLPVSVLNFVGATTTTTTTTTTSTTTSSPTTTQAPAVTSTTAPQSQTVTSGTTTTAVANVQSSSLPSTGQQNSRTVFLAAISLLIGLSLYRYEKKCRKINP